MPKCTKCVDGQMSYTFKELGKPETKGTMNCIHCHGTGQLSQEDIDQIEWEEKQWCQCKEHQGTKYWPDNTNPICSKHCWTCTKCKKLVQVG